MPNSNRSPDVEPGSPPQCQACAKPLDLSQPDERRPERLLGVCLTCGTWYLVEATDAGNPVVVRLANAAPRVTRVSR